MSMSAFMREIAAELHHRGAFIDPAYPAMSANLRDIASIDPAKMEAEFEARKLSILAGFGFSPEYGGDKPFAFAQGTAIIPVHGMLLNRLGWSASYATGYDFIRSQMNAALSDPDVERLVFDINSSGGSAAGCSELANDIFASRSVKPSLAVVDSRGYSAAFYLGSSASRMVATPSGGVGSIGVVAMHVDLSGALEQDGIKVSFIKAGKDKVEGNSFEPLSDTARASIQKDVDYQYGLFTDAVARNRDMSVEDVRGTEARCYSPPEALSIGLIDAVQTPREAISDFGSTTSTGMNSMQTQNATAALGGQPTTQTANTPNITMEDVQRLVADGVSKAIAADRSRSAGIRTCDEANGREALASHLALNTTMSVDEAKAILAASPKSTPESTSTKQPSNPTFAAAMNLTPNPNVGADPDPNAAASGAGAEVDPQATASRLLSNYSAVSGRKPRQIASAQGAA